MLANLKVTIIN